MGAPPSQSHAQVPSPPVHDDIKEEEATPAVIIIPEGLDVPPWNRPLQNDDEANSDPRPAQQCRKSLFGLGVISTPLCCLEIPPFFNGGILGHNLPLLRQAGVKQLYILAKPPWADSIASFMSSKTGARLCRGMQVMLCPLSVSAANVCDALREASPNFRSIRNDFILLFGDCFLSSSALLMRLYAHHKQAKTFLSQPPVMTRLLLSPDRAANPAEDNAGVSGALDQRASFAYGSGDYYDHLTVFDASTTVMLECKSLVGDTSIEVNEGALDFLSGNPRKSVTYYHGLVDSGVDICSTRVLELISTSFDFAHIRDDLVQGIVQEELKLDVVTALVLPTSLKSRASSKLQPAGNETNTSQTSSVASSSMGSQETQTHEIALRVVTVDALRFVIDRVFVTLLQQCNERSDKGDKSPTETQRLMGQTLHNPQPSVFAANTPSGVCWKGNVISGTNLVVHGSATIEDSFVGRSVTLEDGAALRGCIVLDGVTVGAGVNCLDSVIGTECVLLSKSTLKPDVWLGQGVRIGQGHTVPSGSSVTRLVCKGASSRETSGYSEGPEVLAAVAGLDVMGDEQSDPKIVGQGGAGWLWRECIDQQKDDTHQKAPSSMSLKDFLDDDESVEGGSGSSDSEEGGDGSPDEISSISQRVSIPQSSSGAPETEGGVASEGRRVGSVVQESCGELEGAPSVCQEDAFFSEVYALSLEGLLTPQHLGNKALEIKSFRLASDRRAIECVAPMVKALLVALTARYASNTRKGLEEMGVETLLSIGVGKDDKQAQEKLLDLIFRYSMIETLPCPTAHDEEAVVDTCEPTGAAAQVNPFGDPSAFARLLQLLAKKEVLNDEFIPNWWRCAVKQYEKSASGMLLLNFKELVKYVIWLEDVDSTSEESDSE